MANYIIKGRKDFTELEAKIVDFFTTKILTPLNIDCHIAGGAIREFVLTGTVESDYDIYCDKLNIPDIKWYFISKGATVERQTENSTLFRLENDLFDVVDAHPSRSIVDTISRFDFTVCGCGIKRDQICYHESYFDHLSQRSLVLNSPVLNNPNTFLGRLQKYVKKGFTVLPKDQEIVINAIRVSRPILKLSNDSPWNIQSSKFSTPKSNIIIDSFDRRIDKIKEIKPIQSFWQEYNTNFEAEEWDKVVNSSQICPKPPPHIGVTAK